MYGVLKRRSIEQIGWARHRTKDPLNHPYMDEGTSRLIMATSDELGFINEALEQMADEREDIRRLNDRSHVLAQYFRIEASRDERLGDYFRDIAESLGGLGQQINDIMDTMADSLTQSRHLSNGSKCA